MDDVCVAKLVRMKVRRAFEHGGDGKGTSMYAGMCAHISFVCVCVCVCLSRGSIGRSCRGKDMGNQYAGCKQREGQSEQIKNSRGD